MTTTFRNEHDLLGFKKVPAEAYYGVHTLRAVENFNITGIPITVYPDLIRALAQIKKAAARANQELGLLDSKQADAICAACVEIIDGKWHDQFVVDVIQGGAGTSTNMNANEVIANRALEILGHERGEYQYLHPNEDVNMSQSTNDVYPTALKLATYTGIYALIDAMAYLRRAFERKAVEISGIPVITAPNLIEATQDCGSFVQLSGILKRIAVKLSKACNDLRLLSSGPRAGLGEINLPPRQAGSSIMPGKVNPVIPEVVNQIAYEVIGNDITVTFAAEGGQLQLNAFEPIIAHSLFKSVTHLRRGCLTLADNCVNDITANREVMRNSVHNSIGIVTALNPFIGYENATEVASEAFTTGRGIVEIVIDRGLMSKEQLDDILRPEVLTQPQINLPHAKANAA